VRFSLSVKRKGSSSLVINIAGNCFQMPSSPLLAICIFQFSGALINITEVRLIVRVQFQRYRFACRVGGIDNLNLPGEVIHSSKSVIKREAALRRQKTRLCLRQVGWATPLHLTDGQEQEESQPPDSKQFFRKSFRFIFHTPHNESKTFLS